MVRSLSYTINIEIVTSASVLRGDVVCIILTMP
nr:MAG TPA: hypothetical protein [Caudoviricetes sp.]